MNTQHVNVAMHAAAIAECTVVAEDWKRTRASSEVAALFAENNNEVKRAARETQILMRSPTKSQNLKIGKRTQLLPLRHVKDGINFVTKEESLALQLADVCAWTIRKRFYERPQSTAILQYFRPGYSWVYDHGCGRRRTTLANAASNSLPVSSMPIVRAASMNRSRCGFSFVPLLIAFLVFFGKRPVWDVYPPRVSGGRRFRNWHTIGVARQLLAQNGA
jgi:hypothetical protein